MGDVGTAVDRDLGRKVRAAGVVVEKNLNVLRIEIDVVPLAIRRRSSWLPREALDPDVAGHCSAHTEDPEQEEDHAGREEPKPAQNLRSLSDSRQQTEQK